MINQDIKKGSKVKTEMAGECGKIFENIKSEMMEIESNEQNRMDSSCQGGQGSQRVIIWPARESTLEDAAHDSSKTLSNDFKDLLAAETPGLVQGEQLQLQHNY